MSFNRERYSAHSNLGIGESGEKPCRNCVDASTWFRSMQSKRNLAASQESSSQSEKELDESRKEQTLHDESINEQSRKECPPFVDELGRSSWTLLHSIAAKFPDKPTDAQKKDASELMRLMSLYYPCEFCADDLKKDLKALPIQVDSQENFARWMCNLHNLVNKKLGKKEFDCNLVQQRWRDGWVDGSCDKF